MDTSTEEVKSLAYVVLIECDYGHDHNLTFLANQVPLSGSFLVGNMDNLISTHRCPGISYLNMVERSISLLKNGLASLVLRMDPDTPEFLHKILTSVSSINGVQKIITE